TATPDGVVLRYGGLYGPGTSLERNGSQSVAIRRRLMPIVGAGGGVVSYLHVEDAEPVAFRDWLPFVADVLGARPPRHLPVWLARIVAGDAAVYLMTRARGGSNARAKAELGWKPTYPD